MSHRTIDDILLDDSDDDNNDNNNDNDNRLSTATVKVTACASVDLETLLLEEEEDDDDDDDDDDKNSNGHVNKITNILQSSSSSSYSWTDHDTNDSSNNMISLLNTLQGFDKNENDITHDNRFEDEKEGKHHPILSVDGRLEVGGIESPISSVWDPKASAKQKLTALMAADRREQQQLLVGSKEIVSALHLHHSKDGLSVRNKHDASIESKYNNVKCIELETLSSQLMRNASYKQHGPGIATVVCAHSKFIAIGTSKGLILLFDYNQEIRQVIGSTVAQTSRSIAPVTCLSINNTGTCLICGHESGEVALWDITKGSVLKRVTDLHASKIIRINFIRNIADGLPHASSSGGSDYYVISADDKGVVRTIHFTKMMWTSYMADSECLLDSTSGAILDMVPLTPLFDIIEAETDAVMSRTTSSSTNGTSISAQKFQENILTQLSEVAQTNMFISNPSQQFVAFNSVIRTYIVQVQPIVRIIHKWAAPDCVCDPITRGINPEYVACIDWYWNVPRQATETTLCKDTTTSIGYFNPLIARSWGGHVEVQSMWASDTFTFKMQSEMLFNCNILGLKWIAQSRLVLLTTTEIMVLSSNLNLMERTSLIPKLQLSLRSSLDERASLSQPIPSIFSSYAQRFYIMTPESLCSFHLQSWVEIADQLIRGGKWLEALALIIDCVAGKASDVLTDEVHVERFIKSYVDLAVTQSTSTSTSSVNQSKSSQVRNHYHLVAGVCIEYCALTCRLPLLFGPLYDAFNRARQQLIFLDSLEPYITSKIIVTLPPHILSNMLDAATNSQQRLASLDRMIAFLDVNHIDLDSLGKFLLNQKMFSSFLYVYSSGLHDFGGAFHIVFDRMMLLSPEMQGAGDSFPTPLQADTGYKLLLFLQYSAEGKVFPRGDSLQIPSQWLMELMEAVLSEYCHPPYGSNDSLAFLKETRSPYLYYMVRIDSTSAVHCVATGLKKLYEANKLETVPCKAFPSIIGMFVHLFDFIETFNTDLVARDEIHQIYFDNVIDILAHDAAPLPMNLMLSMIKFCNESIQPQSQAESILVSMVYNQCRYGKEAMDAQIRDALESHNFWRAVLNMQNSPRSLSRTINVKDFERAIRSYLKRQETDLSSSQQQVFTFIQAQFDLLSQDNTSGSVMTDFCQSLCRKVVDLMDVNQDQTKVLVCNLLQDHISYLIECTKKHPFVQFELLKAVVGSVASDSGMSNVFVPDDQLVYIKLMISYAPEDLYLFVRSNDSYPLDECLVLCREHSVADATSWLLEKTGEINAALSLLLTELSKHVQSAKRGIDMHLRDVNMSLEKTIIFEILNKLGSSRIEAATRLKCFADLSHYLNCCIGLCSRNSSKADPTLWFTTFEFLLKERQSIRLGSISSASEVVFAMIGQLIQSFMVHMRTCVSPKEIILTVTQAHATGTRYEEFKDVMTSMIDSYSWETLVQETLVDIHLSDLFNLHMRKYSLLKKSVRYEDSFEFEQNESHVAIDDPKQLPARPSYHRLKNEAKSSKLEVLSAWKWKGRLDLAPPNQCDSISINDDGERRVKGVLPFTPKFFAEYRGFQTLGL